MQFISTATCNPVDFYAYADYLEEQGNSTKAELMRRVPEEMERIKDKQRDLKSKFEPYGSLMFFEINDQPICQFGLNPYPIADKSVHNVTALPQLLWSDDDGEESLHLAIAIGPTLGFPLLKRDMELFGRKVVLMYGGCSLGSSFLSHLDVPDLMALEERWEQMYDPEWKHKFKDQSDLCVLTDTLTTHEDFMRAIVYICVEEGSNLPGTMVVKDGDDFICIDPHSGDWIRGRAVFDTFAEAIETANNWTNGPSDDIEGHPPHQSVLGVM